MLLSGGEDISFLDGLFIGLLEMNDSWMANKEQLQKQMWI